MRDEDTANSAGSNNSRHELSYNGDVRSEETMNECPLITSKTLQKTNAALARRWLHRIWASLLSYSVTDTTHDSPGTQPPEEKMAFATKCFQTSRWY